MQKITKEYDLLVIGGGSGGIASGRRAASIFGKRVAIVENRVIGGTCVNVGCVPKKVMFNLSTFIEELQVIRQYGLQVNYHLDFHLFKQKRDAYVARLNSIYTNMLTNSKVDYYQGTASFISSRSIKVQLQQQQQQQQQQEQEQEQQEQQQDIVLNGEHILIASGSTCETKESFSGQKLCLTSDDIFKLQELPQSMIVLGGGYIGVEMAQIFQALGVEVTLVCRSYPLKMLDEQVRQHLYTNLHKLGIKLLLDTKHTKVEQQGNIKAVHLADGNILFAQQVLCAIGREPNLASLNLAAANIQLDSKGYIKVDSMQNTSCPFVYAVGDVTQAPQLTPVAIKAGRILIERLFHTNKQTLKMDYSLVPTVIFSHPPIGVIGPSEQEAQQLYGIENVKVYSSSFTNMFYSLCEDDNNKLSSLFKVICRVEKGGVERVVGVHAIGRQVDEVMQGIAIAVTMGATKKQFDQTIPIHPTAAEEFCLLNPTYDY